MRFFTFASTLSLTLLTSNFTYAEDDIENGREKFTANCQACHGELGRGDGPAAASLPNRPANLAKKLNKPFSSKYFITNGVLRGKVDKGMPAWQDALTRQDVYDILAYVEQQNLNVQN